MAAEIFDEPRQKKLFGCAKEYFKENKPDCLHNIDHIARVVYWAKFLCKKEGANPSIVVPAAILHDIAIPKYGDRAHARKGAKICRPILKKCNYSEEEIEKIAEIISMHSTEDPKKPKTKEARILFDADKLDVLGPIALYRWLVAYSDKGLMHHEALQRILEEIDGLKRRYGVPPLFTDTAKRIGKGRLAYLEKRCKEMLKDLGRFREIYKEI